MLVAYFLQFDDQLLLKVPEVLFSEGTSFNECLEVLVDDLVQILLCLVLHWTISLANIVKTILYKEFLDEHVLQEKLMPLFVHRLYVLSLRFAVVLVSQMKKPSNSRNTHFSC